MQKHLKFRKEKQKVCYSVSLVYSSFWSYPKNNTMNCKILISISIGIFLPICSTAEETSSLEVLIQNLKNGLDGLKANSLQVSEDASLSIVSMFF